MFSIILWYISFTVSVELMILLLRLIDLVDSPSVNIDLRFLWERLFVHRLSTVSNDLLKS